ncbi:MAG: division/cell wall cluster transcriptional repressor MraZ [Planctomycetota bacterium]
MAFFVGEFEQTIDSKRRLAITAGLRESIDADEDGQNFILILGPERHLWLYPDVYYRRLMATMRRSPLPSREQRKIDLLFAMARLVKPDSQGRIVLPERSVSRADIAEHVMLVGMRDHIEIWPAEQWNARAEAGLETYGEMLYDAADRLAAEPISESSRWAETGSAGGKESTR